MDKVTIDLPDVAYQLAERFFPGQLTLVLRKDPKIPDVISAGGSTVAVRVPDHDIAQALIRGMGGSLVGTSANISGKPSPVTASEVFRQLGDDVDFIVDGGRCRGGVASTVIDLSSDVPMVIREGAVPVSGITAVCPLLQSKIAPRERDSGG